MCFFSPNSSNIQHNTNQIAGQIAIMLESQMECPEAEASPEPIFQKPGRK